MIVKDTETMPLYEQERCINGIGFESRRILLKSDNMGFGLNRTIIPKGGPYKWHYKNHKEACYCIKGIGYLIDMKTGNEYEISPGKVYILNNNDLHTFEAFEDVELISIFNPPLNGSEIHKKDGSYEV